MALPKTDGLHCNNRARASYRWLVTTGTGSTTADDDGRAKWNLLFTLSEIAQQNIMPVIVAYLHYTDEEISLEHN